MFDEHAYTMEEDYCSPVAAMEKRSILNRILINTTLELVESDEEG
jgi:hypothetical protein